MDATKHPFSIWLDKQPETRTVIAQRLRISRMTLRRYELGRMPSQPTLDGIVILTEGEVDANSWLGKEAANVVASRTNAA